VKPGGPDEPVRRMRAVMTLDEKHPGRRDPAGMGSGQT
jgi:hypothetical protein